MKVVVVVFTVEAIPIGVLAGGVLASPLPRLPRFSLRLAAVVMAMLLPMLVALFGRLGEQTAGPVVLSGLPWGIVVVGLSRFVLFHGSGLDPGSADDDDDGPGPGDDRPTPPAPIGGIPLADAAPSSMRVRDHRPSSRRGMRPRRPVREGERAPSRLWPLQPWPFWRTS